jgi:hypothetical protein
LGQLEEDESKGKLDDKRRRNEAPGKTAPVFANCSGEQNYRREAQKRLDFRHDQALTANQASMSPRDDSAPDRNRSAIAAYSG